MNTLPLPHNPRNSTRRSLPGPKYGTTYLLHFDSPYRHARHYVGWAGELYLRLAQHGTSHGARLLQVVAEHGIGWRLARTWSGTSRHFERRVKRGGAGTKFCPLCCENPRPCRPRGRKEAC